MLIGGLFLLVIWLYLKYAVYVFVPLSRLFGRRINSEVKTIYSVFNRIGGTVIITIIVSITLLVAYALGSLFV